MMLLLFFVLFATVYTESLEEIYKSVTDPNADMTTIQRNIDAYTAKAKRSVHSGGEKRTLERLCLRNADISSIASCQVGYTKRSTEEVETFTAFQRMAVFVSNVTLTNANVVLEIMDPGHNRALAASRGMYTRSILDAFDVETKEVFANVMGPAFDFRNLPIGSYFGFPAYVTPYAVLLPYVLGLNDADPTNPIFPYRVGFDSEALLQGGVGNWSVFAMGSLALVTAQVTTPQGIFYPGNGIGHSNYVQVNLEASDWSRPINRIVNRILPPSVSFQISPTMFASQFPGFQLSLTPSTIIDSCCRRGTGVITVHAAGPRYDNLGVLNKYSTFTMYY